MGDSNFQIIWENSVVGKLNVLSIDMWYWECKFEAELNGHATGFVDKASQLNLKKVFSNLELGIHVELTNNESEFNKTKAVIINLEKNIIFLRILK